MQKNKLIEPFFLKSKITDSIDREEILECYICCEKYDHQVRIPTIACLSCIDIACLKCLKDKCQIYKVKGMINTCNKCPREMIPDKFKKCLPTLTFIEIYQKIKSKENHYRQTCQALKEQLKEYGQNQKKFKIQLQRLDKIFSKILKQKQESSKQLQKLNETNSKNLQNIHALTIYIQKLQTNIKQDEIQKIKFISQIQDLKITVSELKVAKQTEEKGYHLKTYQLLQQICRLNQLLEEKQQKDKKNKGYETKMTNQADSEQLNKNQLSPLRKTTRQLQENDKLQKEAHLLRKRKTKK